MEETSRQVRKFLTRTVDPSQFTESMDVLHSFSMLTAQIMNYNLGEITWSPSPTRTAHTFKLSSLERWESHPHPPIKKHHKDVEVSQTGTRLGEDANT
jgi:hypothetical protein